MCFLPCLPKEVTETVCVALLGKCKVQNSNMLFLSHEAHTHLVFCCMCLNAGLHSTETQQVESVRATPSHYYGR